MTEETNDADKNNRDIHRSCPKYLKPYLIDGVELPDEFYGGCCINGVLISKGATKFAVLSGKEWRVGSNCCGTITYVGQVNGRDKFVVQDGVRVFSTIPHLEDLIEI